MRQCRSARGPDATPAPAPPWGRRFFMGWKWAAAAAARREAGPSPTGSGVGERVGLPASATDAALSAYRVADTAWNTPGHRAAGDTRSILARCSRLANPQPPQDADQSGTAAGRGLP